MKTKHVIFVAGALALSLTACENRKNDDSKDVAEEKTSENLGNDEREADADFAIEAADGGLLEVQLATLATTKASNPQVKEFARMMLTDHGKANDELKSIAGEKGIVLPDVMSEEKQKEYYDLDQKNGAEFDREYIDLMVSDHKEDIRKFEREAENGEDPELKAWAAKKVPTLKHHLQQAETIQKSLDDNRRNN